MDQYIDTKKAREIVARDGPTTISLPTIIEWCRKYGIGQKMGGRWYVDRELLIAFIEKGSDKWNVDAEKKKILQKQ